MKSRARNVLAGFILGLSLTACARWERAEVTVTYDAELSTDPWNGISSRRIVELAFQAFAKKNGYECHAHRKRVEELTCRGPKDLQLLFRPSLNKPEFFAVFSWVDVADRSHAEFMRHVATFQSELGAIVGPANVRSEVQS